MNEFGLEPLNDRVVVEPTEAGGVTPGGIVIPDVAKEKPTRGKVVAVGPGKFNVAAKIEGCYDWEAEGREAVLHKTVETTPEDVVIYPKHSGTTIEVDGRELVVLREDDILMRLRE